MKQLILITLFSISSLSAFAADELKVLFQCGPEIVRPDVGISLQVLVGGIAGVPQIKITRYKLGRRQEEQYMAQFKNQTNGPVGGATVLAGIAGSEIKFSINMTTAPGPQGKRRATVETKNHGKEYLLCAIHSVK